MYVPSWLRTIDVGCKAGMLLGSSDNAAPVLSIKGVLTSGR